MHHTCVVSSTGYVVSSTGYGKKGRNERKGKERKGEIGEGGIEDMQRECWTIRASTQEDGNWFEVIRGDWWHNDLWIE